MPQARFTSLGTLYGIHPHGCCIVSYPGYGILCGTTSVGTSVGTPGEIASVGTVSKTLTAHTSESALAEEKAVVTRDG